MTTWFQSLNGEVALIVGRYLDRCGRWIIRLPRRQHLDVSLRGPAVHAVDHLARQQTTARRDGHGSSRVGRRRIIAGHAVAIALGQTQVSGRCFRRWIGRRRFLPQRGTTGQRQAHGQQTDARQDAHRSALDSIRGAGTEPGPGFRVRAGQRTGIPTMTDDGRSRSPPRWERAKGQ